jgi:hypothetical protein
MVSNNSELEWIKKFNEVSREFYFHRYIAMFKPTSAISSIILPSYRYEIKIGINHLTRKDKNQIKSMEDVRQQVLGLISIVEDPIKSYYERIQQQTIEKAIKYYNGNNVDINNNNIAIQLIDHINVFCDDDFSFKDAIKVIEENEQKYSEDFIHRLLGSIVPIIVENRGNRNFNQDIKNIVEDFMKHDLDMMIIDIASEKQRRGWVK